MAGPFVRMPDDRLLITILFAQLAGSRVRGRSQKSQVADIREDLHSAGLAGTLWRRPYHNKAAGGLP